MPESFRTDPLVYQGVSDQFLPATADIAHATTDWGIDFEAEIGVAPRHLFDDLSISSRWTSYS